MVSHGPPSSHDTSSTFSRVTLVTFGIRLSHNSQFLDLGSFLVAEAPVLVLGNSESYRAASHIPDPDNDTQIPLLTTNP
jgi:hypothetical protein